MQTQRFPSRFGRTALMVHGLALLAAGTCAGLLVWAKHSGNDYDMRIGAVVAGTACLVCWLWSATLAVRALWQGEVLGWAAAVLLLWTAELLTARCNQWAYLPHVDVDWLILVRDLPTWLYLAVLTGVFLASWRRLRAATPQPARPWRARSASLAWRVLLLCAAAALYVAAPQPRFFIMDISRLRREAPASFRPSDPGLVKKMAAQRIRFEFVDTPVNEGLAWLSRRTGVTIVLDERVGANGWPTVNLHVTDSSTDLALQWVLKVADLEYLVRGDVVIVSRADYRLNLQEKVIRLPVRDGEPPWTLQETSELCAVSEAWELSPWFRAQSCNGWVKVQAPGELSVCTIYDDMLSLEAWLKSRSHLLPSNYSLPDEVEAILDWKIAFQFAEPPINTTTGVPLFDDAAIASIWTATLIEVRRVGDFEPRGDELDGPPHVRTVQGVSIREVLLGLHRSAEERDKQPWAIIVTLRRPRPIVTLIQHDRFRDIELQHDVLPFLLDLSPALKAGVDRAALRARLGELLDDAGIGMPRQAFKIRDYWIARADPWTAQRAVKLVEEAAKTGKVPPLPPAPWFFATFPQNRPK